MSVDRKWWLTWLVTAMPILALSALGALIANDRISSLERERDALIEVANTRTAELGRLKRHCDAVRTAFRMDAADLRGHDAEQERAAWRFQTDALHSYWDLELCARDVPNLGARDACVAQKNYPCVAELAQRAADAIEVIP